MIRQLRAAGAEGGDDLAVDVPLRRGLKKVIKIKIGVWKWRVRGSTRAAGALGSHAAGGRAAPKNDLRDSRAGAPESHAVGDRAAPKYVLGTRRDIRIGKQSMELNTDRVVSAAVTMGTQRPMAAHRARRERGRLGGCSHLVRTGAVSRGPRSQSEARECHAGGAERTSACTPALLAPIGQCEPLGTHRCGGWWPASYEARMVVSCHGRSPRDVGLVSSITPCILLL